MPADGRGALQRYVQAGATPGSGGRGGAEPGPGGHCRPLAQAWTSRPPWLHLYRRDLCDLFCIRFHQQSASCPHSGGGQVILVHHGESSAGRLPRGARGRAGHTESPQ